MSWREFIAQMTGNLAWPVAVGVLVGVLIVTQRKAIADLIGRTEDAQVWGARLKAKAKADQALDSVGAAAAVEPPPDVKAIEQEPEVAAKVDELLRQERENRQRQVAEVAKQAALWGQYMTEYMPNKQPGLYWEPQLDWQPDGSVGITYGKRGGYDEGDLSQQPEVRLSERITSEGKWRRPEPDGD